MFSQGLPAKSFARHSDHGKLTVLKTQSLAESATGPGDDHPFGCAPSNDRARSSPKRPVSALDAQRSAFVVVHAPGGFLSPSFSRSHSALTVALSSRVVHTASLHDGRIPSVSARRSPSLVARAASPHTARCVRGVVADSVRCTHSRPLMSPPPGPFGVRARTRAEHHSSPVVRTASLHVACRVRGHRVKFSHPDGQQLGYQKILDALREERTAIAARHAADARSFFGGDLDHPLAAGAFRYIRSGKSLVCTDDNAVAQWWLKLLQDRHDVAAQWAATRNITV